MFATLTKLFTTRKTKHPRKPQAYRPCMEGLEDRMLMAGDIHARFDPVGTLVLSEASGQAELDHAVQINQLVNGMVHVEGVATADGTKSLIDGAAFRDFNVPNGLWVQFGAGRNFVTVGDKGAISFTYVHIQVGNANVSARDSVVVEHLTTTLTDTLTGGANGNSMYISTGAGDDFVSVSDTKLVGRLGIEMGRGNDTLDIQRTAVNDLSVLMDLSQATGRADDFGQDTVRLQNLTAKGSVILETDPRFLSDGSPAQVGGNDFISMSHVSSGKGIFISSFGGQDTAKLYDVHAVDKLFTSLGAGNDTLSLIGCGNNEIEVDGGSGHDRLSNQNLKFKHMRILGFEEIQAPQLNPNLDTGLTLSTK